MNVIGICLNFFAFMLLGIAIGYLSSRTIHHVRRANTRINHDLDYLRNLPVAGIDDSDPGLSIQTVRACATTAVRADPGHGWPHRLPFSSC